LISARFGISAHTWSGSPLARRWTGWRTLRRRKESYVGPWLPEPLLTAPDVAEDVELAESVSMAMLLVLETLMPTERAVFVLREVFGLEYDEIAGCRRQDPGLRSARSPTGHGHTWAARRPRGGRFLQPRPAARSRRFQRAIRNGRICRGLARHARAGRRPVG